MAWQGKAAMLPDQCASADTLRKAALASWIDRVSKINPS
jgi:hypothetical protein